MASKYLKKINPIEAFIEYVLETKPYHTKILEVLEEYIHEDLVDITIDDQHIFGDPRCKIMEPCLPCNGSPEPEVDEMGNYIWNPTDYCEFKGIEMIHPAEPITVDPCLDYTYPVVDRLGVVIDSPNENKNFYEYPAINGSQNRFYIPGGDLTKDFAPNSAILLTTRLEDRCDSDLVLDIDGDDILVVAGNRIDLGSSPPNGPYKDGYTFFAIGSDDYRRRFVVVGNPSLEIGVGGQNTRIRVYPALNDRDKSKIQYINVQIEDGGNTGTYTVKESRFVAGSIDQWPDSTDPNSYIKGDGPYTFVETNESLVSLTVSDPDCQFHRAYVSFEPQLVESVLSYSNHLRRIESHGSPAEDRYWQNPDEGYFCAKILEVVASEVDPHTSVPIDGTGKFVVQGIFDSSNIKVGDLIKIENSPENVGTYTITEIVYLSSPEESTEFTVFERVLDDTINTCDDVVTAPDTPKIQCGLDGDLCPEVAKFQIPSNVVVVDGDFTHRFRQGKRFIIEGGTLAGTYVTHSSRYINGKTMIRTTATVLDTEYGKWIREIRHETGDLYVITIAGDNAHRFPEGAGFNIVDSENNDGSYTVAAPGAQYLIDTLSPPEYDPDYDLTEIPVQGQLHLVAGGKILEFAGGRIKDILYSEGETNEWCDNIPYTMVKILFDESIHIEGSVMDITNEPIIVYNLENRDRLGYELSSATVFVDAEDVCGSPGLSPVACASPGTLCPYRGPDVVSIADAPPGDPEAIPFWFDTSVGVESIDRLKRYVEGASPAWQSTHTDNTIWWVRTQSFGLDASPVVEKDVHIFYKELYSKKIYYEGNNVFNETDWVMELPYNPGPIQPGFNQIYPGRGNIYEKDSASFAATDSGNGSEAESVYTLGITVGGIPGLSPAEPDPDLIRVYVNGTLAGFTIDSFNLVSTNPDQFEVTIDISPPVFDIGDIIFYRVFDRKGDPLSDCYQHNAHVFSFDREADKFFNDNVGVYKNNSTVEEEHGALILGGGDHTKKFTSFTEIYAHEIVPAGYDQLGVWRSHNFPITHMDRINHELTIEGDYSWLFKTGRTFYAQPSKNVYSQYSVVTSTHAGGETTIEVNAVDSGDAVLHETPVDIIQIIHTSDSIEVDCNRTEFVKAGDQIEIINSAVSPTNNGVYNVESVSYDVAGDVTTIVTVENIGTSEAAAGSPDLGVYLPVVAGERTAFIVGAVYEPDPDEVDLEYSDWGSPAPVHKTDATFVVTNRPVHADTKKIDYHFRGPVHVETEYPISEVTATDFTASPPTGGSFGVNTLWYEQPAASPTNIPHGLENRLHPGDIVKVKYSSASACSGQECVPTTCMEDSFTGSDGTLISDRLSDNGKTWQVAGGSSPLYSPSIKDNLATHFGADTAVGLYDCGSDVRVTFDAHVYDAEALYTVGAILRADSTSLNNGERVFAIFSGSTMYVYHKVLEGSPLLNHLLGSFTITLPTSPEEYILEFDITVFGTTMQYSVREKHNHTNTISGSKTIDAADGNTLVGFELDNGSIVGEPEYGWGVDNFVGETVCSVETGDCVNTCDEIVTYTDWTINDGNNGSEIYWAVPYNPPPGATSVRIEVDLRYNIGLQASNCAANQNCEPPTHRISIRETIGGSDLVYDEYDYGFDNSTNDTQSHTISDEAFAGVANIDPFGSPSTFYIASHVLTTGSPPGFPIIGGTVKGTICLKYDFEPTGFANDYDPVNWTFRQTRLPDLTDPPTALSGSINTTGAPDQIVITGQDDDSNYSGETIYEITMPASGLISFDWAWTTNDASGSHYDPAVYVYDGVETELTSDCDNTIPPCPGSENGSVSFFAQKGKVFSFRQNTDDATFGAGVLTITNFHGPCESGGPVSLTINESDESGPVDYVMATGGSGILEWDLDMVYTYAFTNCSTYQDCEPAGIDFEILSDGVVVGTLNIPFPVDNSTDDPQNGTESGNLLGQIALSDFDGDITLRWPHTNLDSGSPGPDPLSTNDVTGTISFTPACQGWKREFDITGTGDNVPVGEAQQTGRVWMYSDETHPDNLPIVISLGTLPGPITSAYITGEVNSLVVNPNPPINGEGVDLLYDPRAEVTINTDTQDFIPFDGVEGCPDLDGSPPGSPLFPPIFSTCYWGNPYNPTGTDFTWEGVCGASEGPYLGGKFPLFSNEVSAQATVKLFDDSNQPGDEPESVGTSLKLVVCGGFEDREEVQDLFNNDSYYVVRSATYEESPIRQTLIEVETDYALLPPFETMVVKDTQDYVTGVGGRIIVDGNKVHLMDSLTSMRFFMDRPVVSVERFENYATVINYYFDNVLNETIIDVEEFIISGFTGNLEIVDFAFIPGVCYDANNPTVHELWNNGTLIWESFHVKDKFIGKEFEDDDRLASTAFLEHIAFQWSEDARVQNMVDIDFIDPSRQMIFLKEGASLESFQKGEDIAINGTENNDGKFEIVDALVLDGHPILKVKETLAYGEKRVLTYQNDYTVKVEGHLRMKIKKGDEVEIRQGARKTGKYVATQVKYEKPYSLVTFDRKIDTNLGRGIVRYKEKVGEVGTC